MQVLSDLNRSVSDIVRQDYRTADVFKKYGISYCCSGQLSLKQACDEKSLDYLDISMELEKATRNISLSNYLDFNSWKIDFLVDYIVNVHHSYIYHVMPALQNCLDSFVNGHRQQFPALVEIRDVFHDLAHFLVTHNRHEEEIIFPYIKQIESTYRRKETYGNLFVRTLRKPLSNIEVDHRKISMLLNEMRELTGNYRIPPEACTTHQVIYYKLKELDNDMVQHKHLENNILFPKAIEIEKALLQW